MVRKISYLLLSLVILGTGMYGAKKLRYWERSVWVFKTGEAPGRYQRRGAGERERFDRSPDREFRSSGPEEPDGRGGSGGERPERSDRERPDRFEREDLPREQVERERSSEGRLNGRNPGEGRSFEANRFDRGSHDGHAFRGRKNISLRNVIWFLAVFAGFTVLIIYIDKGWGAFLKRKKHSGGNPDSLD